MAGPFHPSWNPRCSLKSRENVCPHKPLHTDVLSPVNLLDQEWKRPKCPSMDE